MRIEVFIENEAGATTKHLYDEQALVLQGTTEVSRAYPWPYGFLPGTWAADACCADCFVITDRPLVTGTRITCEAFGLLEQFENGVADHNVLAVPVGEMVPDAGALRGRLTDFVGHVFDHVPDKNVVVGRLLGRAEAESHIRSLAWSG